VARAPDEHAPPSERALGRTPRGRLALVSDAHVGLEVLVETLDEPLGTEELVRLRDLAAAGGPHVQRILAVTADGLGITYESLDGEVVRIGDLRPAEIAALEPEWTSLGLSATPDRRVARTPGGPVI